MLTDADIERFVGPGRWLPNSGSAPHREVATLLEPFGDHGLGFMELAQLAVPATARLPVAHATGEAGDVYLCHPFLVHAASWPHRGTSPRWIAQPALDPGPGFDVNELGSR